MLDSKILGEHIKDKRIKLGMTQTELGERIGTTDKNISKWEVGRSSPTMDFGLALSEVFGCTIDEMISGEEQKQKEREIKDFAVKYLSKHKISDDMYFDKNGQPTIMYGNYIYDYESNESVTRKVTAISTCKNPFLINDLLAKEAKTIVCIENFDEAERKSNANRFECFREQLKREIIQSKYDVPEEMAYIFSRSLPQKAMSDMYLSIRRNLNEYTSKRLREVSSKDLTFDYFDWSLLMSDADYREIVNVYADKYLKAIAEEILETRKGTISFEDKAVVVSYKKDEQPVTIMPSSSANAVHRLHENGYGIDCYHRFMLTSDELSTLYEIALCENQIDKLQQKGLKELSSTEDKRLSELSNRFDESFKKHNFYGLDCERVDDRRIAYTFYDYHYSYMLIHRKNGWESYCRISFYEKLSEPIVEMDEPDEPDYMRSPAISEVQTNQDYIIEIRQLEDKDETINIEDITKKENLSVPEESRTIEETFLSDKIYLNGAEYGRGSFEEMASYNNCEITPSPIEKGVRVFRTNEEVRINGTKYQWASFVEKNGKIIDMILRPYYPMQEELVFTVKSKKTIEQDSPFGKMRRYVLDDQHTAIMCAGIAYYMWTDE